MAQAPTHEPETQQIEQPRHSNLHGLYWALALLPILYLLSVGPAAKLQDLGLIPDAIFRTVYNPMGIVAEHSYPFRKFLLWYLHDVWHCYSH